MTNQTNFNTALLDAAQPVPTGIINPDGAPATKRFDVYRNNVAVSLTDALEAAFPVIHKLVGPDFFRAMAGVFLRQHPPTSPLMMFYGAQMPAFLSSFPPAASLPYLPDIALLELAIRTAYHAADAASLDPEIFSQISEDSLPKTVFAFAPSVQIVISDFPIHGIWAANMTGAAKPESVAQSALVTRPEFDPRVDALTPDQSVVLAALMAGNTLGDSLSLVPKFDLGPMLTLLLQRRAITTLTIKD